MLYPELDKVVAKHFGEGYMSSFEIERNVTMLFVNANPVIHDVRPVMPNTVLIGDGIHLQPPKPLSQVYFKNFPLYF